MREMKDSGVEWIGEIPKGWDIIQIKKLLAARDGGSWGEEPQEDQFDRTCYRVADFDFPRLAIASEAEFTVRNYTQQIIDKLSLERGDILVEKSGGGDKTPVGRAVFYDKDEAALFANFIERLRVSSETSPRYFFYVWIALYLTGFTNNYIKQTTGIQNLDLKSLVSSVFVPSFDLKLQHCIADYLDAKCALIDRMIARQQEVIEKLKEYKLSVITEAVTKGLNPDVPMKNSGIEWIGKIPEGWDLLKLRFAVENIGDIDHYMPASVDIGIPYVMTGDLHDLASAINFQECKMVSTEDYVELSSKISIKKGDLLFARYATIGTMCYVDLDREFLVSYSCVIIKPNEDLMLGKFLYYVMKSNTFAEEVKQYTNSNTQGNVGIEALYRSKVVVPSVSLQKEIIGFLEEKCTLIDKSIDSKMGLVNKLEEYKKSLIYEVVTGKREV